MSARVDSRSPGESLPEGFAELPALVYRDDPRWIPEDASALMAFSPMNPWFRHGKARLFSIPGQARAAAFFHPEARSKDGKPVAFFGYWETRAEATVDALLFAEIDAWARSHGAVELWGPINFSTAGNYRLLLSAEPGHIPFPGEPYNPSDYSGRLLGLGFAENSHYCSFGADEAGMRRNVEMLDHTRHSLTSRGYRIEPLAPEYWLAHLAELREVCNQVFAANLGYTPVDDDMFRLACGPSFIRRIDPTTSSIIFGPKGDLAGLFLVFPDYGPLVSQSAGEKRVKVGDLDHAKHFAQLCALGKPRLLLKTTGVTPAHRRQGIFEALWVYGIAQGLGTYGNILGALVRDDNHTGKPLERLCDRSRHYALYARSL